MAFSLTPMRMASFKGGAEDVDSEQEDHAPDKARYACMSRPYVTKKPDPERGLRLAVAAARVAALSTRGELYPRGMPGAKRPAPLARRAGGQGRPNGGDDSRPCFADDSRRRSRFRRDPSSTACCAKPARIGRGWSPPGKRPAITPSRSGRPALALSAAFVTARSPRRPSLLPQNRPFFLRDAVDRKWTPLL